MNAMNRKDFIKALVGAAGAAGLSGCRTAETTGALAPLEGEEGSGFLFSSHPIAQWIGDDEAVVAWTTRRPSMGYVVWHQEGKRHTQVFQSTDGFRPVLETRFRVIVKGVDPTKPAVFDVASREMFRFTSDSYEHRWGASDVSSVTLPPRSGADGSTSIVMLNDVHSKTALYAPLLKAGGPAAMCVLAGDILDRVEDAETVEGKLLAPLRQICAAGYAPQYLRGNHELRGARARDLHDWLLPAYRHFYTAFTAGCARLLFLDTGEDKEDGHFQLGGLGGFDDYLAEQTEWVRREVASDAWRRARHRIVFAHIPKIVVEDEGIESTVLPRLARLWEVLDGANVTLMACGHMHRANFYPKSGPRGYPLVVGGGSGSSDATVTRLDVTPAALRLRQFALDGKLRLERTFA